MTDDVRQAIADLPDGSQAVSDHISGTITSIAAGVGQLAVARNEENLLVALIPIDDHIAVPTATTGLDLSIRPLSVTPGGVNSLHLVLTCRLAELEGVFIDLVASMAVRLDGSDRDALTAISVYNDWRELFGAGKSQAEIPRTGLIGGVGELLALSDLVSAGLDADTAVDAWAGPDKDLKDFRLDGRLLEVKSTESADSQGVVVHGLDQLAAEYDERLFLEHIRLAPDTAGESLESLTSSIAQGLSDPLSFRKKLRKARLDAESAGGQWEIRFAAIERRLFLVDADFPRLTVDQLSGGALPEGVSAVSYRLDLSSAKALTDTRTIRTWLAQTW